jgi:effector-binding domain-containing protein
VESFYLRFQVYRRLLWTLEEQNKKLINIVREQQ